MCDNNLVICAICRQVKRLPSQSGIGTSRIDSAFVDGVVHTSSKKLLKKIDKHRDCKAHKLAAEIVKQSGKRDLEKVVEKQRRRNEIEFESRYSETMRLFRTAYVVAKYHLSFCCYTHLVDLQIENGLDMGTLLFSDHACADIIEHIASEMRTQLIEHILERSRKLSLMLDESTSLSRYSALIVYVRCLVEEKPVNYFLDLVDLNALDSSSIHSCLMSCLERHGLSCEKLKGKLIGLASDGASTMTGVHHGLGQLMKGDFPSLFTIHCQAHRLELAVNQAVRSVNSISHFQMFVDSLYSLYSRSPKNQRELEAAASDVGVELLRVGRMFDVRWVFSSFQAVKALWRDFPALCKHLGDSALSGSGRDKAKFSGLLKKMTAFMFIAELALLKDCLRELKSLSLFLQSRNAQITECYTRIRITLVAIQGIKDKDGQSYTKFISEFEEKGSFKGVHISSSDKEKHDAYSHRQQFCQALVDNLNQRFMEATDVVKSITVLDQTLWPEEEAERLLYGEVEVKRLSKTLGLNSSVILDQFRMLKAGYSEGEDLKSFKNDLMCLPISTAECERGFSEMNLARCKLRNALTISRVSQLLFLKINGPQLHNFNTAKYVRSWINKGHRSATSQNRRSTAADPEDVRHTVFM